MCVTAARDFVAPKKRDITPHALQYLEPQVKQLPSPVGRSRGYFPISATTGVGTGEFERLVPVVPEAEGGILPTTAEQTDEAGGDKFASYDGAAGLNREFASQAAAAKQGGRSSAAASQQQLLEDLVPPMGTKTLPGTGIPFVEDSLDGERVKEGVKVGGGGGDARGPGRGRTMSLFERQALQKARTRQQERMETGKPQARKPTCVALPFLALSFQCSHDGHDEKSMVFTECCCEHSLAGHALEASVETLFVSSRHGHTGFNFLRFHAPTTVPCILSKRVAALRRYFTCAMLKQFTQ